MALFGLFGRSKDEVQRDDQLEQWLEETLKRELGADELARDEDGDIPIRRGSAMVYVNVIGIESELPEVSRQLAGFQ